MSTGLIVIGFAPSGVSGATGDEFSIIASVQNQTLVDGSTSRTPVEGVTINVLKADGTPIGEAVTGKDGLCTISVPSRDDYVIELNLSTLPDGLTLIDAEKQKVAVNRDLFTTNTKRVTFFTGESANAGASASERILQRLSDGIRLGLIIAMCSVGLSLVFGTTGLTNFAHGEMVTFGGLVAFYFNVILEIPILISGPVVILMGGLFGLLLNWGIFARLTKRGVTLLSQLVVTVGLSLMLRNIYLFQFGGRTKQLSSYSKQVNLEIGPIGITPRDLTTAILGVIILVSVALFLQRSRLGKAIRAVSDNVQLASATGIDTRKVIKIVWFAGGALAATGGIFRGLDEQVSFSMGSDLLFLMFAGITLGGLGSAFGALIGGFFIGIFVEMSSLYFPSELKVAPALFILIVMLVVRPQGLLGKSQRVG
ncbi:MAG: branched-chain amino acid ABC transporter permease [Ilumatobacteraceae bacterium]|nr:branched-chain amino acid ABC transporter permease [Ilumatobacteraceae bacterium]MBJ7422504.1 branched-chain amino acid ABC transporter permease [Ilumatobacteraceae bacterium]